MRQLLLKQSLRSYLTNICHCIRADCQEGPEQLQPGQQDPRRYPSEQYVGWYRPQDLSDGEASGGQVVLRPVHRQVLLHPAHVRIAEVGLIEPLGKVCAAAIRQDEEVNLEEELLLARRGAFGVPYEEVGPVLAIRGGEEVLRVRGHGRGKTCVMKMHSGVRKQRHRQGAECAECTEVVSLAYNLSETRYRQ